MAGTLGEKFSEIDKRDGWMLLFTALRQQSAQSVPSYDDAKLAVNARLNRYRDVLPFDHSRVRLGSDDGYINANFVPMPDADRMYILTQGPLSHTSGDFWQMVWEQKSSAVIMLNRIMEKGQTKCHLYYPTADENNGYSSKTQKYGNYEVELVNERKTKHYIVRILQLSNSESGENREVTQFQFVTWPDFCVPESTSDFLEFLLEVRRSGLLNNRKYGPPVIHCSAGVGRSGTFVIADAALVIAQKTKDPSQIDIVQMVLDLRQYRMGLIQTHEQLRFSWKAVVDALEQKRWKELLELTCSDDQEADSESICRPDEVHREKRPSLKRLSGNQLTDESSGTDSEDIDEESPSTATASASTTKDVEKSPKRLRPDTNRWTPSSLPPDQCPLQREPNTDTADTKSDDGKKEEQSKSGGDSGKQESSASGTTQTTSADGSGEQTSGSATERYEARLRRRQQRASEMQKKIEKIHENLRRSSSADVWNRYSSWLYGGAVVLVGGLLVYLFCKWF